MKEVLDDATIEIISWDPAVGCHDHGEESLF